MTTSASLRFWRSLGCLALGLLCLSGWNLAAAEGARKHFDIPAGPAPETLKLFSAQTGADDRLLYSSAAVAGVTTNAVKGEMTVREALQRLVNGTGLTVVEDKRNGGFMVTRDSDPNAPGAPAPDRGRPERDGAGSLDEKIVRLETFEVMGSKLLNMDLRRSRDDAQPYVIFDRDQLEQANAADLGSFLKSRLTMNTQAAEGTQLIGNTGGNLSQINLRGLGTGQTLILIDGHRAAGVSVFGTASQSDINWIPLAAVERIEVLPTTASGIFGGSATGGAVNIVLRRDYEGAEVKVSYENTFNGHAPLRRVGLSAGRALEDGRTRILFAIGLADAATPSVQDRPFLDEGRARILANNPGFLLNAANPPLGATPNLRSTDGSNLVLRDGTSLGSPYTFVPAGYAGIASDQGAALVANAGRYNWEAAGTNQAAIGAGGLGLFTTPHIESVLATVRRKFSDRVEGFLDASMANNSTELAFNFSSGVFTIPAGSPANPFNQAIRVTVPVNRTADSPYSSSNFDRRVVGGLIARLAADWQAEVDFTWNQSRYSFTNPRTFLTSLAADIGSGALPVIRDVNLAAPDFGPYLGLSSNSFPTPLKSTLRDLAVRAAGPVFELPAGRPTLSTLVEWRDEEVHDGYQALFNAAGSSFIYRPSRGQAITSAYLEAQVPLFSPQFRRPALESLQLQAAVRYDAYALRGSDGFVAGLPSMTSPLPAIRRTKVKLNSVDPTVGFRYEPLRGIMLRASFGTGFLPPSTSQLISVPAAATAATVTVVDPRRGNQPTPITAAQFTRTGGNPSLRPEESRSVSGGMVFTPSALPGWRLSVDYTRIRKTDIITVPSPQVVVDNEAYFPERVVRAAPVPGDPYGVGVISTMDVSAFNLARALVEACDVALDYSYETRTAGRFSVFAQATWQPHFVTQASPVAPELENVGITTANPLKFKANAGLSWQRRNWTAHWQVRYFDSYLVANPAVVSSAPILLNQGDGGRVPSQVYHDVSVSYRLGAAGALRRGWADLLGRTEVQLGIKNVFDAAAPFDAATSPAYYSVFGDARLRSYVIAVRTAF